MAAGFLKGNASWCDDCVNSTLPSAARFRYSDGRMIRDRRFGPILIIPLALAIGCGSTTRGPLTAGGTNGGAGTGGAAGTGGGSGGAGTGGTAGNGAAGTGGNGAAASTGESGAGGDASGAAGARGGTSGTAGTGGRGGTTGAAGGGGGGGMGGASGGSVGGSAAGSSVGGNSAGSSAGGSAAGGRGGSAGASGAGTAGAAGSGEMRLDPTPGSYRLTCDGSMAVMIDATHFLDGNDEQQEMRLYARGATSTPLTTIDISAGIGLSASDEGDFEDAARIGDRIYVIGSHGRNKNGKLERSRYRFFAMDLSGAAPAIALGVPGYTAMLLDQMLMAENWVKPDAAMLTALNASSNLTRATDPALPPLAGGTNIEGLAWLPDAARPDQLLIGFRSPLQEGKAIVVSLLNADAVIAGVTARFGEVTLLDLGGLSIRSMTWSPVHKASC